MADDTNTLRFPPLSAILGDSAAQSEPTDEPEAPKKHIRKQSRETKKTPFPPRKAPTLEEPKDANAVKPKQTKSRNGTSYTHAHIHTLHFTRTNSRTRAHVPAHERRPHRSGTIFQFCFAAFAQNKYIYPKTHARMHAYTRTNPPSIALLIYDIDRMFDVQSKAIEMRRREARLPELRQTRRPMRWLQEGIPVAGIWQFRCQGQH